jgi:hypothetical protein
MLTSINLVQLFIVEQLMLDNGRLEEEDICFALSPGFHRS